MQPRQFLQQPPQQNSQMIAYGQQSQLLPEPPQEQSVVWALQQSDLNDGPFLSSHHLKKYNDDSIQLVIYDLWLAG